MGVLNDMFKKIKETPKDKALEKKYKSQVGACKSKYKKIESEALKLDNQLRTLKMEEKHW